MDRYDENPLYGPEDQDIPSETQPQRVTLRLGDYEVEVDDYVAQSFNAKLETERKRRDDAYFQKISEQGARLHNLEQQLLQQRAQTAPQQSTDPVASFYADPIGVMEEREARLRQEYQQQREQERQQSAAEKYAERFYNAYDHLASPETQSIVGVVYQQNQQQLMGLPEAASHQLLAELTDKYLERITGSKVKRDSTRTVLSNQPATSERASNGNSRPGNTRQTSKQEPSDDDGAFDMAGYLRKQSEKRREIIYNVK